ncbi:DUF2089 family protein [Lactiplantibacillus paraplantarum]|uniref:DUF2089 family protein n=1 Tax=Lactiplantibacillus paraplantarum TaxID=60520 RepID=UPI003B27D08B
MEHWYEELPLEDMNFIKKFILFSGSLKRLEQDYSVSYPTVRSRLDDIIRKIGVIDEKENEPFIVNVMRMVTSDKISYSAAKDIISLYENIKGEEEEEEK